MHPCPKAQVRHVLQLILPTLPSRNSRKQAVSGVRVTRDRTSGSHTDAGLNPSPAHLLGYMWASVLL